MTVDGVLSHRWYPERATMQSFGRAPELQAIKLQEVATISPDLGKFIRKMLTGNPALRISSTQLVDEFGKWQRKIGKDDEDPLLESLAGVSKYEMRTVQSLRRELD